MSIIAARSTSKLYCTGDGRRMKTPSRLCASRNAEQQLLKLGLTIERSLLASIASRSEVVVATEMTAGGVGGNERPPDPSTPPKTLSQRPSWRW